MVLITDAELAEIRRRYPAAQIVRAKHHHYAVTDQDIIRLLSELRRLPLYAVCNRGTAQRKRQGVSPYPRNYTRRQPV